MWSEFSRIRLQESFTAFTVGAQFGVGATCEPQVLLAQSVYQRCDFKRKVLDEV